jgi:hypothetical protein
LFLKKKRKKGKGQSTWKSKRSTNFLGVTDGHPGLQHLNKPHARCVYSPARTELALHIFFYTFSLFSFYFNSPPTHSPTPPPPQYQVARLNPGMVS